VASGKLSAGHTLARGAAGLSHALLEIHEGLCHRTVATLFRVRSQLLTLAVCILLGGAGWLVESLPFLSDDLSLVFALVVLPFVGAVAGAAVWRTRRWSVVVGVTCALVVATIVVSPGLVRTAYAWWGYTAIALPVALITGLLGGVIGRRWGKPWRA
jgi:hypothetical protein